MSHEPLPLISVIVPIYKVEDYLDECVESIIRQTHSNLEIILVDDGSPDSCPQKCEQWAQRDHRIRVVHKKNGGLSSARNAGLEVANGEYIGFVDSDDLILPDMYEKLLDGFSFSKDIAVTNGMILSLNGECRAPFIKSWVISEPMIIKGEDFFELAIRELTAHTAWSKLYKHDLIRNIRFPEGRNNEDTYFMFEISKELEKRRLNVVNIPHNVYLYRMREGSICNSKKTPLGIDIIKNLDDFKEYFHAKGDPREQTIDEVRAGKLFFFCISMAYNPYWKEIYFKEYHALVKKIPVTTISKRFNGNKGKIANFWLLKYFPSIYLPLKRIQGKLNITFLKQ